MIDYNNILNTFIDQARAGVGSRLSSFGPTGTEWPSVIKARGGGTLPDYPYVMVDVLSTVQTYGWQLGEALDENNNPFVDTTYKLLLQYTVYGGNANSIANELEGYFRLDRVLSEITNATGGALEQTFDVNSVPQMNSTENLEVATFNLTFNIVDRITDPATGTFNTINLDGELNRYPDDPAPINLDISVSSI